MPICGNDSDYHLLRISPQILDCLIVAIVRALAASVQAAEDIAETSRVSKGARRAGRFIMAMELITDLRPVHDALQLGV
jgi:hypothetical protein